MRSLVWYAILYAATAAFLRLVGLVPFLWLAHSLPVQEYAGFGLLIAVQSGLATFAIAGIVEAVVGLIRSGSEELERATFAAANVACVLMTAVSAVLALGLFGLVSGVVRGTNSGFLYAIASGALLAFCSLQAQIVRLREDHVGSLSFSFLAPLAGLICSIIAFAMFRTVAAYFLGNLLGLGGAVLLLRLAGFGFYKLTRTSGEARLVLTRVVPYVVVAFCGWLSGYGNNYVVGAMLSAKDVAAFTFGLGVAAALQLVASALNQVWSPRLYRLARELPFAELERRNRAAFRLLGIVLGCATAAGIATYPFVVRFLGGNLVLYQGMRPELLLLCEGYLLLIPWWHCQNYYLLYGKGKELMGIVLGTSVVGTVLWVVLMWFMGSIGVYVGFLAQMVLRAVGIAYAARKQWPVTPAWEGVALGACIAAAGLLV